MGFVLRVFGIPFTGTMGGALFVAGLAFEATRRGASLFELGLMTAGYQVMRGLSAPLAGALSDRVGSRRPFVVGGALVLLAGVGLALVVPGVFGLIMVRSIQGLGAGFLWPGMQTVVAETAKRAGTALSAYFALGQLGQSAGFAVYSRFLADRFVAALVVAGVAFWLTFMMIAYAVPSWTARRVQEGWYSGQWRAGILLFVAAGFSGGIIGVSNEVMLGYLGINRGLGARGAALALLWGNLLAQGVMFLVARVADRQWYTGATFLAFALMGVGGIALPFSPAAFVGLPLTGLLGGAYSFTPLSRVLAGKIDPGRLGTSIGLMNMSASAGGVLFPPLMGGLIEVQSAGLFPLDPWAILGVIALLKGFVLAFVLPPGLRPAGGVVR